MDRVDAALVGIMKSSPDDVPIDVRVFLVRPADLELLETFLEFAPGISVHSGLDQGHISLRATGVQIEKLAANHAIRRIEFDVQATDEPEENMPPGGRAAERYREFISGRFPEDVSLLDDSLEEEPDPDPDPD